MALTTENLGAVLVGRAPSREIIMQTRKITVLRPFYFNRLLQQKGTVVELPSVFAGEMIAANKAKSVPELETASAPTAAVSESGATKGKKETTNAGK